MEDPLITAELSGLPPGVVLRGDVTADAWTEIALTVSDELPRHGRPIVARPDRFLARRASLRGVLERHGIAFRPSEDVMAMLRIALENQVAIAGMLRGGAADGHVYVPVEDGPYRVVLDLRVFQRRDCAALVAMRHGANFSVPGAGKTAVTYAVHAHEAASGRVGKLLVVAPLSAFSAWEDEAVTLEPAPTVVRWRGGQVRADTDVVLVNYQRLASSLPIIGAWMREHRVHLVADEAHRAKRGVQGEWGRALMSLAPLAVRRDVLTGTPAPNHPRDLAALLEVIWPGGAASGALPAAALRADPPDTAMDDVNRAIRPFYVRTTKAELRLPRVTIIPEPVDMGPLQRDIYAAMLHRYAGMLDLDRRDAAAFALMGEVAVYLLQAASSPRLLAAAADPARAYRYPSLAIPPGSSLARMVEEYADHEVPAKIAAACRIVHRNVSLNGKTLVWSNFPDNLLDLEQQLAALSPALIYGAIVSDDEAEPGVRTRERELRRFREDPDCKVLLANPAALAEGVSLHMVCNDAVYVDRTFNAGQYLQSLDRIHRLGLHRDTETRIHIVTARGTIDDRVQHRVELKTRRLSRMLADPSLVRMALPDDEDFGSLIDDGGDLEEILRELAEGAPGVEPVEGD